MSCNCPHACAPALPITPGALPTQEEVAVGYRKRDSRPQRRSLAPAVVSAVPNATRKPALPEALLQVWRDAARSDLPPTARALYRFCRHCRVHPPEDVWVLQRRRRRPFRLRGPRRPGRPFLLLALHVDSPRPQPTLRTPESHTRPSVPQGRMTGVPERAKEEVDGRGRGGRAGGGDRGDLGDGGVSEGVHCYCAAIRSMSL